MRFKGNSGSSDPGRVVAIQNPNLNSRLFFPFSCNTFMASTDNAAKLPGLVLMEGVLSFFFYSLSLWLCWSGAGGKM